MLRTRRGGRGTRIVRRSDELKAVAPLVQHDEVVDVRTKGGAQERGDMLALGSAVAVAALGAPSMVASDVTSGTLKRRSAVPFLRREVREYELASGGTYSAVCLRR